MPVNSLSGRTAEHLEPGRRIDYVMVRSTLDVRACACIFDQPVGGVRASDPFGVADLAPRRLGDGP